MTQNNFSKHKLKHLVFRGLLLLLVLTLTACSGGGSGDDGGDDNTSPTIADFTTTPNPVLLTTATTFSWIASDADGDTLTCQLDADGDGTDDYIIDDCAANSIQSHSYSTAGVYSARLTVDDGAGGSAQEILVVTVDTPPEISSFSAAPNPINTSTATTFSWAVFDADGDILTCQLDVNNDGASDYSIDDCANNTSQAHTFADEGTYTVSLTVSDGKSGSAQQTLTLEVGTTPPDFSSFTDAPDPTNTSTPVAFNWLVSDPDGDTLTCQLDVDSNGIADYTISDCVNNTSQAHVYSAMGTYTATITASDGLGGTDQVSVTVEVQTTPPVINAFSATPSSTGTSTPVSFSWDISDADGDTLTCLLDADGDGTDDYTVNDCANTTTTTHTYTVAGVYSVRLTINDGNGGSTQATATVTVNDPPVISTFDMTPNPVLTTEVATFSWSVSDINDDTLACQLDVGDGTPAYPIDDCANNTSQTHRYTAKGSYTARLIVDDGNGGVVSDTLAVTVEGNDLPIIHSFDANPSMTEPDSSVTFSWNVSDADGDLLTCILDVGDGTPAYTIDDCANNTSQVHTYTVGGNYTAELIVNDGNGGEATDDTVTVNVNAPPEITGFSISTPTYVGSLATFSWTVSDINNDTITCQLDVDNDGTVDYPDINDCANVTTQDHTFPAAGDYTAKLTVSDGIAAPVEITSNFTVISPLSTDVSVSGPVVAGERALYTLTVGNTTTLPLENVTVSLIVPAELSFLATTDSDPDSAYCGGNATCGPTEQAVWSLNTIDAGDSRTISINALVDPTTLDGTTITLPVTFTATDINVMQVDKNVVVYNSPSADLAVSASTDPVVPGESFTYQFDFGNTSAGSLTGMELRASLPAGVTIDSISDGGIDAGNGEVVWSELDLAVGASRHREVTVTADAGWVAGQVLKAAAQLTHANGLDVDNTAEYAMTLVSTTWPLNVDISTSANPAVANERVAYTVTVSNPSLQPVYGVNVLLRVPAELSFLSTTDSDPDSAYCSGNATCSATEEAVWDLAELASGESRTLTINALVGNVLSGNLITTPIRVTATDLAGDDLGDKMDLLKTIAVYNSPSADLAVSASTDPVVPGESFTYQFDFGNTSAGSLTGMELRASLPAGVTIDSISDGGIDAGNGEVVWSVADLGVGASGSRSIIVVADGVTAGEILSVDAELSHGNGLEIDNRSEFAVTVPESGGIASLLSVDFTVTPDPVVAGGILGYTITVTNSYGLPVAGVNVMLRVPDGVSFGAITDAEPDSAYCGGNATCSAGEEAVWDLTRMDSGTSQVITINALTDAILPSGDLIKTPVRVNATDMLDVIQLLDVNAVQN